MNNIDIILRHILHAFFEGPERQFTQKTLAQGLSCAVSTVFHALEGPRRIGAILVTGRNFQITDVEKLLMYWATRRRLDRDLLYQTHADGTAAEREGLMPPDIIFGAYSACRRILRTTPADYDQVHVYASTSEAVERRFPKCKGDVNITVLKADARLGFFGPVTPPVHTFADLWNLPEWYSQDFRKALWQRLFP